MKWISQKLTVWLFKRSQLYSLFGMPSQDPAFIPFTLCSFQSPPLLDTPPLLLSLRAAEIHGVMWAALQVVGLHHFSPHFPDTEINASQVISRLWHFRVSSVEILKVALCFPSQFMVTRLINSAIFIVLSHIKLSYACNNSD